MALDAYAPCPCGSGQKFKWCCHKIEALIDQIERLYESGQVEGALAKIDDGLRKNPGNSWLTVRKALYLLLEHRSDESIAVLEPFVIQQPRNLNAQLLLVQATVVGGTIAAAVDRLQQALGALEPEQRPGLVPGIHILVASLNETEHVQAILKHVELGLSLAGEGEKRANELASIGRMVRSDARVSPWLRETYELAPPPSGLPAAQRDQFEQALGWANEGLWSLAASVFEQLGVEGIAEANRNAGLCLLPLTNLGGAAAALSRYLATAPPTPENVDLEGLVQLIAPVPRSERVALVHWIWTLRDRNRLLESLRASDRADEAGTGPLDANDPKSFEVEIFEVLDRPKPVPFPSDPEIATLPRVVARVLVGRELAILEGFDDGRLEGLSSWLSDVAGPAIPPAHPKTKEISRVPRMLVALESGVWTPEDLEDEVAERVQEHQAVHILTEVWPRTPMPYLGGRTPTQAAADGNAEIPLRAALRHFEHDRLPDQSKAVDFAVLRRRLNLPDEPIPDPETVDVRRVHMSRLGDIPADRLDDDRLLDLFRRAHATAAPRAIEHAARALADRPELLARPEIDRVQVFADLAFLTMLRGGTKEEAYGWLERGRAGDATARTTSAVNWELAELRLQTRAEPPEVWVPNLAVILDRYRDQSEANSRVLSTLLSLGIIRVVPQPDQPGQMLLDTRPLQALLMEYGPRVTTASGGLGLSATKPGIWTPGAPGGGGATAPSGLWTPGSGSPDPSSGKKLILPG